MNLSKAPRFRHNRRRNPIYRATSLLLNTITSVLVLFTAAIMRDGVLHVEYIQFAIVTALLQLILFSTLHINSPRMTPFDLLIALLEAWIATLLILMLLAFVSKTTDLYSRAVVLSWIPASMALQYLLTVSLQRLLIKGRRSDKKERVLVVGAGEISRRLVHYLLTETENDLEIVGTVCADPAIGAKWNVAEAPILGSTDEVRELVAQRQVNTVYLALDTGHDHMVRSLYLQLIDRNIDIHWAPDISGMMLINPSLKSLGGLPVLSLSETPLVGDHARIKALFDRSLAVLILLVASPLMLVTALAIRLTSPGPVIFRQRRYGWNGEEFDIMKFRSMKIHAEENGGITSAVKGDPRVTPVGRIIRRSSIDELPQLFNVLEGTMSLVGPRPHATVHDDYYSQRISSYFGRLKIKPGLTGLAQVNGFRGEITTVEQMETRLSHDLDYINNWSLWLDLKILMRTFFVLGSKKAY